MEGINSRLTYVLARIQSIGADPDDSEQLRFEKSILVSAMMIILVFSLFWAFLYLNFYNWPSAAVDLLYALVTSISLQYIARTRRISTILKSQIGLGLVIPFFHNYLLGGFESSSAVILWSLIALLASLIFFTYRRTILLMFAYLGLLIFSLLLPPIPPSQSVPALLWAGFFVLNIGGVSTIVLLMLNYFIQEKNKAYRLLRVEQEKAENLLLNILPAEIAAILKNDSRTIADSFEGASILFADLVGFTPLTASMAPVEMVDLLNRIFSHFDSLVEKYQVEKIRTIGDSYMVAAGVPRPRPDHARALAYMALEMESFINQLPPVQENAIQFRIGINSGPVVGGVIGRKKFVYDVWGDAVNVASRMESHGIAGKIQITQNTYELICDAFECQPRGWIEVKGRGKMMTWFLLSPKAGSLVEVPIMVAQE